MKRIVFYLALWLGLSNIAAAQTTDCLKKDTPPETFNVKGLASDAAGPLANLTVIAFPFILPDNQPVTRFWLQDVVLVKDAARKQNEFVYRAKMNEGALTMSNPTAVTDNVGSFVLKIPKGLFMVACGCKNCPKYKQGEVAIGVFAETGTGRWQSTRELIIVKADPSTTENDVGELTFKPAGPDK